LSLFRNQSPETLEVRALKRLASDKLQVCEDGGWYNQAALTVRFVSVFKEINTVANNLRALAMHPISSKSSR